MIGGCRKSPGHRDSRHPIDLTSPHRPAAIYGQNRIVTSARPRAITCCGGHSPATLVLSVDLHWRNHQVEGLITAAPAWWNYPALLLCDLADKLISWLFLSCYDIVFSLWHPPCPSIDQRNLGDLRVYSRCGRRSAASAFQSIKGGCQSVRRSVAVRFAGVPVTAWRSDSQLPVSGEERPVASAARRSDATAGASHS